MDWATSDYTRTYADTIFVPEPGHDAGVYLLDEAGPDSEPPRHRRAPFRRGAGATPIDEERGMGSYDAPRCGPRGAPLRENYYTGGNVVSGRGDGLNGRRVFDVAWDERPAHYSPRSGPEWAHLVPDPRDRPHGGGPAPSLAFPKISHSEAIVAPYRNPAPAPAPGCWAGACGDGAREGFQAEPVGSRPGAGADYCLQALKIGLLFVIVVLLAMMAASAAIDRCVERALRDAVRALRTPDGPGRALAAAGPGEP